MFPSYFPMDGTKRCLACAVLVLNCATFGLLCASMLTQDWVVVRPVRTGLNVSVVREDADSSTRFQGMVHFGLFDGKKVLNYGFGNRIFDLKIVCVSKLGSCMYSSKENSTERVRDLHENFSGNDSLETRGSLADMSTWVVCVSSVSLAAMFAATGAAFAVANVLRTSAQLLCGFLGLLVWNICGVLCGLSALFSWLLLFLSRFRQNVMTREELEQHWVSAHRACVGRSFYLAAAATALAAAAAAVTALIVRQPWVDRRLRAELRKKLSCKYASHSPASSIAKDILAV